MTDRGTFAIAAAAVALLSAAATSSLFYPAWVQTESASPPVALPKDESLLYVANGALREVSVIATKSLEVLPPILVRADVREVALDHSGRGFFAYLTDVGEDNVITLGVPAGKIYGTYPSGAGTLSVTPYPLGGYVYVINSLDHSVSVVDSDDHKELNRDFLHHGTFSLGVRPMYSAFTPDMRFWYTDAYTSSVGVVNVAVAVTAIAPWVVKVNVTSLAQIKMPSAPGHIATTSDGREVLVGVQDGLIVINASTYDVKARITLPETPATIVSSPRGDYFFAAAPSGLYVVSARNFEVSSMIRMAGGAYGLALSPDGSALYASNPGAGTVTVLDGKSLDVISIVVIGGVPMGVSLHAGGGASG